MSPLRWEGFGGGLERVESALDGLLKRSQSRAALLMDSAGRLLSWVGDAPRFDVTTFVSLLAADFCATQELARILGEEQFHSVCHQGESLSLYLAQVTDGTILCLAYDRETTLGLVRFCVRQATPALMAAVNEGLVRPRPQGEDFGEAFGAQASAQLARLFDAPH